MATDARLPFEDADSVDARIDARDRAARERAVDPRFNVALEASAGTGKTRVLVDRYVNLLRAGVDPAHILAITFTRKAAAEMRGRILATLRTAAERGELPPSRWADLRDRTGDIAISTIDAFCLGLLREFPLEADVDPGFSLVDDTELPRLIDESLDRALQRCRAVARHDEEMALVFAQLGERRARAGLAALLQRRLVAPDALARFLRGAPAGLDVGTVSRRAAASVVAVLDSMRGGFERFRQSGPLAPAFQILIRRMQRLRTSLEQDTLASGDVQAAFLRLREHFLTQDGQPRARSPYAKAAFASEADWRAHTALIKDHGDAVLRSFTAYRRELNVLVSRGVHRMFAIAHAEYRRTLDARAVLDFPDLLLRSLDLLRQMDEFSRSRYRLESRYHHVLVDEFQDTSRAQWELVSLLIQSWGEGAGLADTGPLPPSIFIVGDRKQSIYGFRDADVSVLREAARQMELLRPDRDVRRSISRSFRAVPALLAFVNDVCHDMADAPARRDGFEYGESDRFPVDSETEAGDDTGCLGIVAAPTTEACADIVAGEIVRLLAAGTLVRDRDTGLARSIRPSDVAILFRSRESHREFEEALGQRDVRTYVYRGLGFFDTDEIKDVLALLWYLADPESNLRAAALMRSRVFGISDDGLRRLAPGLAEALITGSVPADGGLGPADAAALALSWPAASRWRALTDRLPPAELVDVALSESGYLFELRGARHQQARENLKKMRALLRRLQNRGYATLSRVAEHVDRLALGDEANAAIDAIDAVHLMTVHASKGLEFPVVFVVNLSKGTGSRAVPVRVSADAAGDDVSVSVGDFQSDADEERAAQEREESKRLVYVALTRARDRLYLASALKEGRVVSTRGSFSEVMPPSLLQHFTGAASKRVEWTASAGGQHHLSLYLEDAVPACTTALRPETPAANEPDDFAPLVDTALTTGTVSSLARSIDVAWAPSRQTTPDESDRLVGRAVHRLLQRFGFEGAPDDSLRDATIRMCRGDVVVEESPTRTVADVAAAAVSTYRRICAREDVRSLYGAGEPLREVPFTMRLDNTVVRGTIDCLIRAAERVVLLEFKTGRPHEDHRAQVDLDRRAAERLFPGMPVEAVLVYPGEVER